MNDQMTERIKTLKDELEAADGRQPADLLIDNIQLVDVYSAEIRPSRIAIKNDRIVGVDLPADFPARQKLNGHNAYALPGFIDTHVHIETTLLTPEGLSEVIAPWGTTSLFVDAMEITNVCGVEGLLALVKDTEQLSFRIFLEIPSRVPTAPGLETTGAVLAVEETRQLMELDQTLSLGEMDPSKVLTFRPEYLEKILTTLDSRRICNGHAIGLNASELNVYATAHLSDDHECVTIDEVLNRLRVGICILVREGSSERNTREIMKGVVERTLPTDNLMFCTDDKHVNDIYREGHISHNVQIAIDLGLDPIAAIKMATINAARHFRMDHLIGSLTPGRYADLLLLDDLKKVKPSLVIKGGKIVAKDGKAETVPSKTYAANIMNTVRLAADFSAEKFRIPADGKWALCRVITLIKDQIINQEAQEWLPIIDGAVMTDPARDLAKLSVVERHGKNGRVSNAFVQGFGLKRGALASSVSHDHHNIVAAGVDDHDMAIAVEQLNKMQGGFAAVADGEVIASFALPLAGLMSLLPPEAVQRAMDDLNAAVRALGVTMAAPFMTLSFISLPTVPELGLTDYGLIDVKNHQVTNLIVAAE